MSLDIRKFLPVALATLSVAALAACDSQKAAAPPAPGPVEVGAVTLHPQNVTLTTELPGRTAPYRIAEIRPQVSGILQKRLFEEGALVKTGQQLYQIDPASYEAALDSARADLAKAEANLLPARTKAQRYAELVKINAVSRQDNDDAIAALAQAQALVASGHAEVKTAQINLNYTRVLSPITGRIGRSAYTEGALVTANQANVLATVQQLDPIYVDVSQSSAELVRLRHDIESGHLKGVGNGHAPVSLTIDASGVAYDHPGELQFSEVTVDPTSGAVTLRASFPNPHSDLLPGLFVRATIQEGVSEKALLVPQRSLFRSADGSAIVWTIDADSKAAPRPVKTAQAIGDQWLVTDGVKDGDQVIIDGVQKLRPGVPVKLAAPANPPNTATPGQSH